MPVQRVGSGGVFLLHALAAFASGSVLVEAIVAMGYGRVSEAIFRAFAATAMYAAAFFVERLKLTKGG